MVVVVVVVMMETVGKLPSLCMRVPGINPSSSPRLVVSFFFPDALQDLLKPYSSPAGSCSSIAALELLLAGLLLLLPSLA